MASTVAGAPQPHPATAFWRTITRIDKTKINTWIAFRNSLGVALPLGIGLASGEPLGAVAITTGALNVSYSDGVDPYRQRARRMLAWSTLGAVAVFTGSATGRYHGMAIIVAATWAFIGGMLVAISTRAGDLGLNTLVTLIVFSARAALSPKDAFIAALLVLCGGLLQTGLALAFWPLRREEPERRVIGQLYLDLAKDVHSGLGDASSLPVKPLSAQAQETIAALGRDHTVERERYRLLFDQVDRIRLSSFMLDRLRETLTQQGNENARERQEAIQCIDELLDAAAKLLAAIGQSLIADEPVKGRTDLLAALHVLFEKTHSTGAKSDPLVANEVPSAMDTLAGQLRAVLELAQHASLEGLAEFEKRQQAHPWKLQVISWLATLRANFHFNSPAFRHAVRLATSVAIADAIGRTVSWQRSYWLPMTVAVVLKPDFTSTFSRGVLRLAGTFGGLLVATALYHVFPTSALSQLFLVGAFTFLLRSIGPANYGVFSIAISGLIVFLIAATGVSPRDVVVERALNTAAGGVLALIFYAVWPTWERTQVSESVAEMLDACRLYFRAIVERFEHDDPALEKTLDADRGEWRRARSNAEASVDRMSAEPGVTRQRLDCFTSILAHSHALVHAMMALEAGVIQTQASNLPPEFGAFAHDVEFTLYFLAQALRGSAGASNTLPKLRDDHTRLVKALESFRAAYEFVFIETDRLTTALNTLREQVVRCVAQGTLTRT